jgi:hypothetical protein
MVEKMFEELTGKLIEISNCNRRQLYRYLDFYRIYPQIVGALSPQFKKYLSESANFEKVGMLPPLSNPGGLFDHVWWTNLTLAILFQFEEIDYN